VIALPFPVLGAGGEGPGCSPVGDTWGTKLSAHSSMGVDREPPPGMDWGLVAYLRAKAAAEEEVPRRDLDWTILRPVGSATVGTGRVWLAAHVDSGGCLETMWPPCYPRWWTSPDTSGLCSSSSAVTFPSGKRAAHRR
jgi:hypothetical protein